MLSVSGLPPLSPPRRPRLTAALFLRRWFAVLNLTRINVYDGLGELVPDAGGACEA